MPTEGVKVTIYVNESDEWHHRPLHLEILKALHDQGLAGGTVLHGVAGFTGRGAVHSSSLVDAGGGLPLVIEFIDTVEHVDRVMPGIRKMAAHRLITREKVLIENDVGQFD